MEIKGFTNPNPLGEIPHGWQVISIDSLCLKVTSGGTPLGSNANFYTNGTIRWLKTQELKDWYIDNSEEKITLEAVEKSSAKIFPINTLLMAMYGDGKTITSLGILRKEAATNQACCALIANPEICYPLYLFYALKYHRPDFIHIATGGAQRNLSGTLIRNFAIKVPPLPEQKAITHILGTLDDKIELNREMNRTLETIAWTIFNSWFQENNFPETWQMLPLEQCMAEIIDYRGKTPKKTTSGIPLITAKIVKNGRISKPEEYIAIEDYDSWMRRGFPTCGDVVMTTEAPLGEIAQLDGRKVALAQRLITLRGKPGVIDNTYLRFLILSSFVQEQLHARATGTTVLGIRQSELRKVNLVVPPFNEQIEISRTLGSLNIDNHIFSISPFFHFKLTDSGHQTRLCCYKKKKGEHPEQKFIYEVIGDALEIDFEAANFSSVVDEIRSLLPDLSRR